MYVYTEHRSKVIYIYTMCTHKHFTVSQKELIHNDVFLV